MENIINIDKVRKGLNVDVDQLNTNCIIEEKQGKSVPSLTGDKLNYNNDGGYIKLPKRKKQNFHKKRLRSMETQLGKKRHLVHTGGKRHIHHKYISSDDSDDSDFNDDPVDLNMKSYRKFKFRTRKNKRKDMYLNALNSFRSRGATDGYNFNDGTSLEGLKTMYEEIATDEKNKTKYQLFKFLIQGFVWGSEWVVKKIKIIDPTRIDGWSTLFNKRIEGIKPFFDEMVRDVEEYDEETGQVTMITNPSYVNQIPANPWFGLLTFIIRSFTMYYLMRDIHGLAEYITKNDNDNMKNMLNRKK